MLKVNYASVHSTNEVQPKLNKDAAFLCSIRSELVVVLNPKNTTWSVIASYPNRNILGDVKSVVVPITENFSMSAMLYLVRDAIEKQIQKEEEESDAHTNL